MGVCRPKSFFIDFGIDFEGQRGDKMETKTDQNRTQKSTSNKKACFQDPLGTVLGRLGVDLGVKRYHNLFVHDRCFVNITFLKKITIGRAS